jgi:hypothetical protein
MDWGWMGGIYLFIYLFIYLSIYLYSRSRSESTFTRTACRCRLPSGVQLHSSGSTARYDSRFTIDTVRDRWVSRVCMVVQYCMYCTCTRILTVLYVHQSMSVFPWEVVEVPQTWNHRRVLAWTGPGSPWFTRQMWMF